MSDTKLKQFIDSEQFHNFIIYLIFFNSITIGMETSPALMNFMGSWFEGIDTVILYIFIAEILLKLLVYRLDFFKSGWNVFDFLIVAIAAMPVAGPFAVFRTLRILRTLRLLNNVPKLRFIIDAIFKAIPSIGWIMLLLAIVFYIFAVLGTNLYGQQFPEFFGSMGASTFTLFQIMTLESWSSGIARPMMRELPYAYFFFVPFILIATYTTLNIFIAIVVNTMNEINADQVQSEEDRIKNFVTEEHEKIRDQLESLKKQLEKIDQKVSSN
ncbi:MAG: ion transporter [Bacteroidetes bacterium]|nr:ion transporter [Bacteroidota bacterium]MDA1119835.1 ion transporter [Bacteroidota bacterium]